MRKGAEIRSRLRNSRFFKDVAESYILRILQTLVGLMGSILIARLLGPEGQGQYAAAFVLGTLGAQLGNFGIHWANNYYVAQNRKLLPKLMANSLWAGLVLGGFIVLILLAFFNFWPNIAPVDGTLLGIALAWIPLSLIYLLFQFLLVGIQKTTANNAIELAGRVLKVLLMAFFWGLGWAKVDSFLGAAFLSLAACLFLNFTVLRKEFRETPRPSWALFKAHMNYGFRAYFSAFFSFLVLRIDQLMVKYLAGAAQTGYYATAVSMGDAVSLLPVIISVVLFPKLSAMKSFDQKFNTAKKVTWMTALALIPLFLLAAITAKPALRIMFGDRYIPSIDPLLLLLPGLYFLSIQWVLARFLHSVGFPKLLIASWALAAVFNIAINFWTIPHWGIDGASISSSLTYFLVLVLTLGVVWHQLHLKGNVTQLKNLWGAGDGLAEEMMD